MCFSNKMSSLTSKTVSFNIFVGTSLVDHEIAKKGSKLISVDFLLS